MTTPINSDDPTPRLRRNVPGGRVPTPPLVTTLVVFPAFGLVDAAEMTVSFNGPAVLLLAALALDVLLARKRT